MTSTLDNGTTVSDGCQIGIPIMTLGFGDATVMDPADYARLCTQEAHLRAVIDAAGMTLVPLGYVRDHRVQYEVRAAEGVNGQTPDERRAAIGAALASLVSRARRAEPDVELSSDVAGPPMLTGSVQIDPAVACGTQPGAPSPAPDCAGEGNTESSAPGGREMPKPTPAVTDPIRDGQLWKDIKLGPPVISVDGHDVAWASALEHTRVEAVGFNRSITCSFGPRERYILDRHNTRYRSADPHPNEDIREGSVLEVDGVKTEQVLIATVSPQVDLGFDADDGEDD